MHGDWHRTGSGLTRGRVRLARVMSGLFALLAVVCLALPAQMIHFVVARHVVCAEHGELVHGSELAESSSGALPSRAGGPSIVAGAGSEHDHEHCHVAVQGRERSCLERPAYLVTFGAEGPSSLALSAAPGAGSAEQVYRLAPKTSPPLA